MADDNERLLISFYGDDFTGSTDAMEALAMHGIKTVLFLELPTRELLEERFPDIQAFGVAGVSRSMTPLEMEQSLRPILEGLKEIPTCLVHYKICSTFDSSPTVGSIGYVMDLAAGLFNDQTYIPLLVGAPALKRYTIFGHHFATVRNETFRLDRHPTMSRHPITPMAESDLRLHLGRQTAKKVALLDLFDLEGDEDQIKQRLSERMAQHPDVLLFDVFDEERLRKTGRLIWEEAWTGNNRFIVGSSGVEYALAAHWQQSKRIHSPPASMFAAGKVDRMVIVSGSCSPVTESQIRYAEEQGFISIRIPVDRLIDPRRSDQVRTALLREAAIVLQQGKSPIFYTALGPEDPSIHSLQRTLAAMDLPAANSSRLIGEQLGRLTREMIAEHHLKRFIVAGGDTSGFVTRELDIYALECCMPIAPGGPLCLGYSENPQFHGIQLVLKGGQVGQSDFFVRVLNGK